VQASKGDDIEEVKNPLIHFLQYGLSDLVPPNESILPLRLAALRERCKLDPCCVPRSVDLAPLDDHPLPSKLLTYLRFAHDESVVNQVRAYYYFLSFHEEIRIDEATLDAHLEVRQIIREVAALANQKRFVQSRTPDATVIIPVYEQLVHTLSCLRAVLTSPTRRSFEIIVADDASGDATARVVRDIGGVVRLYRAEKNIGFVRNCNAAAGEARGSILVFLNNDTLPLPGWLDELVACLRDDPRRGLAGSKLLNRDGTLQEAGGIIWEDGSAWNFGRGKDPAGPSYNYVQDADYVSGAAIAVSAELWRTLGGFDTAYAPAYYEDVDLAFRVRAAGLRTVYQPFSNVIHLEGASHGRELSQGVKAYQLVNKETFYQRWKEVLAVDHFVLGDGDVRTHDRSRRRPRLLVVDHYVPEPDRDSGSRAMFDYLTLFVSAGFHVTFWPDDLRFDRRYTPPLQRLGIEVIYHLDRSPRFDDWLAANAGILDYAILSRPHVTKKFLDKLRLNSSAKIIYFGVDIHFQRYQRQFDATGSQLSEYEMMQFERSERDIWPKSDVICYYSNEETAFIRSEYPGKAARTVPIFFFGRDRLTETRERVLRHGISKSKQVIFVAGFRHPPNVDAMLWLASAIWPDVVAAIPEARLCVVGSSPPPEISGLASPSILVTGHVSDEVLALLYSSSSACVVPLRFGAGVKGKVLEAISFGAPVVTTPTGVQGIPNGAEYLDVCAGAREISDALIQILQDPDSRRENILKGLDYLSEEVSEATARRIMSADVPELLNEAHVRR
jgi:GT2 family glycosyltransferase